MELARGFAGSVPEQYDRYMGPIFFEPYAEDLAARLPTRDGTRVLELACGTGIVTRRLYDALPRNAHLVATDLNDGMLVQAQKKFDAQDNIVWRQADATQLPFEDHAFDAIVCQFGVMFFPDKLAAFREARRVLARGGTLLFNVWDALERNPLSFVAAERIAAFFPNDPPRFYDVPFGFHDRAQIAALLTEAGFTDIDLTTVTLSGTATSAQHAAIALVQGTPMAGQILARIQAPMAEVVDAVAAAIAERFGEPPVHEMNAIVATARA